VQQEHRSRSAVKFEIRCVDPQGIDALGLLRLAAIEARRLYPELHPPGAPRPVNDPLPDRGVYLIAYAGGRPVAMGAHYPLDHATTEVRRMFTVGAARRSGAGTAILASLERHAREQRFVELKLETGFRQTAAMRLYESLGYRRIPAFGLHAHDPTSVCFAKRLLEPDGN
jgi:putative acetyltransferase